MCSRDHQTQVVRLGNKCLYPLCYVTDPQILFLNSDVLLLCMDCHYFFSQFLDCFHIFSVQNSGLVNNLLYSSENAWIVNQAELLGESEYVFRC